MYSGLTLTAASGRLVGAHQKIDRAAHRQLRLLLRQSAGRAHYELFPNIKTILHFEGKNGPDGIKRKSPAQDEPWHYLSPFDANDTLLLDLIEDHFKNLVKQLKAGDTVAAGFEAAWLAHAIVDGLTPAHHYPYEERLDELRGGLGKESRTSYRDKLIIPGSTRRETFTNNWKMWGPKGLLTTHIAFEWGVSSIILPMRFGKNTQPTSTELDEVVRLDVREYFLRTAKEVAAMEIYDKFYTVGWTPRLARAVRRQLAPTLVRALVLMWYKACREAMEQQA